MKKSKNDMNNANDTIVSQNHPTKEKLIDRLILFIIDRLIPPDDLKSANTDKVYEW